MDETERIMLERAIEVAVVSHAGQVDKNGEPYILHPLRVTFAVRQRGGTVAQQAAAVLHDVIEDFDVPDNFLISAFRQKSATWSTRSRTRRMRTTRRGFYRMRYCWGSA